MKIYTGGGDRGRTSLFSGERVPKDHARIKAYGDVDELNAVIGALVASLPQQITDIREELQAVQSDLFHIGAWMATSPGAPAESFLTPLDPAKIEGLERAIDRIDEQLPPIKGFILPGGHAGTAWAHVARTVCRRAERHVVRLAAQAPAAESGAQLQRALVYLNRLSDYFFVLARHINRLHGIEDILWKR
jgi:cob(I)alamin adenosyltransferase